MNLLQKTSLIIFLSFCSGIVCPALLGQSCTTPISSYPHNVDFENGVGDWTQGLSGSEDDFDWSTRSGSTPSFGTGPTAAYQGDDYIYTEASSSNNPAKVALLISPCYAFHSSGLPSIDFVYHMQGSGMGELHLDVSVDNGNSWTAVWSRSGEQSTEWINESVDLSAYRGDNVQLRFRGITGSQSDGWQSDIGLDHITVYGGPSNATDVCDVRVEDGLIAYYDFKEGQGNIVHDLSGVGIPMHLSTSSAINYDWVAGGGLRSTGSVFFSYDRPAVKIYDAITTSNSFTVEAWVAPDNNTQDGPARIATYSENTSNRNFTLGQQDAEYHSRVRTDDGSISNNGTPALETEDLLSVQQRQHIVYTFDGASGSEQMYINGILVASDIRAGQLSNWDDEFVFGILNETSGDRPWEGILYSLAMYDKVLSPEQIQDNVLAGETCGGFLQPSDLSCDDYADVDLICTGLEDDVPSTITIPSTVGLDSIRVEIVYKGGNPGTTITVEDDQGISYTGTRVSMVSNASLYSFDLPSTSTVTYSNTNSESSAQSMCVYMFTSGVRGKRYVTKYTEISALPNSTEWLFFELPYRERTQDISIIVPISEVTYDNRLLNITARAGQVSKTISRTWGNNGEGFPDGCCVDTIHITLPDVPPSATHYALEVESPGGVGQSYVLAGLLAVEIDCGVDEICDDELDNDYDGLTDCDDPDCDGVVSFSVDVGPDISQCYNAGFSLTAEVDGCVDYGMWSVVSGNAVLGENIWWTEIEATVLPGETAVIRYTAFKGSNSVSDDLTISNTTGCITECIEPLNQNGDLEDEGTATNFDLLLENTPALLIEEDKNPKGWQERYGPSATNTAVFDGAYYIKKTGTQGDPYSGTHFTYIKGTGVCLSALSLSEELPCGSTYRFSMWVAAYSYNTAQQQAPFAIELGSGGNADYYGPLVDRVAPASSGWNALNWQRYVFDVTIPASGYTWADFYFTSRSAEHGIAVDDVCITMIDPGATAIAGADQQSCTNSFQLTANSPTSGYSGMWSVESGDVTVVPANSPMAVATINSGSVASVRWTVDDGTGCASEDVVTLAYTSMSDIAVRDTTICEGQSVELAVEGCSDAVLWSTGETTNTISVSPTSTTDYSVTCSVQPSANLLDNPGFEDSSGLGGWQNWSNSSITTAPSEVHSGNQAILADAEFGWAGFGQSQEADAGAYYELTVWAACDNLNNNPYITLTFSDGAWQDIGKPITVQVNSLEYKQYQIRAVAPIGTEYMQVSGGVNAPYARLVVDDFYVAKISGCVQETTATVTVIPELITMPDSASACPNGPSVEIDLSSNDVVPVGAIYTLLSAPTQGSAGVTDAGMLRYSMEENYCGVVTMDYYVCYEGCCEQSQVTITLADDEAPQLTDPGSDLILACDHSASLVPQVVTGTDNCSGQSYIVFSENIDTTSCASAYTINRTWTTNDACTNTSSETRSITIADSDSPALVSCPADVTVDADNIPAVATVVPTDACSSQVQRVSHHINNELRIANSSEDFLIPQFSPDLGELVAVEYYIGQYLQFKLRQENSSLTSSGISTFSANYSHDITGPSSISSVVQHSTSSSVFLDVFDGEIDFAGPSGYDYGLYTFTNSSQGELTSDLSGFIGTGDITFTETAGGGTSFSGGGNAISTISTKVKSNYTITYVYTNTESPNINFQENVIGDICDDQYTIRRSWTISDPCGNESTCTQNILVENNLPEPSIQIVGGTTICEGADLSFSVQDEGDDLTYDWNFGDNAIPTTASGPGPHTVSFSNTHITGANQGNAVSVTVGKGSCTVTDQTSVTVRALPVVSVSYVDATCDIPTGSITFTFPDNSVRTNVEFSLDGGMTYPYYVADNIDSTIVAGLGSGTYDLRVRWGNDECPIDLPDVTISNFDPPVLDPLMNASICSGEQMPITATASNGVGALSYMWNQGLDSGATKVLEPATTTTYTVTVTDSVGCSDSQSFTVTVNANPAVNLDVDHTEVCAGDSLELSVIQSGYDYQWNAAAGSDTTQSVTVYVPAQTGSKPPFELYGVTVTDANGCTAATDHLVRVYNLPTISAVSDTICFGDSGTISALAVPSSNGGAGPYMYAWSSGNFTDTISVSPASTTQYVVTATDQEGCAVQDTAIVMVHTPSAVTLSVSDMSICEGNPVFIEVDQTGLSYLWGPSARNSTSRRIVVYPQVAAGASTSTTTYEVTVTDSYGCPVVASITITATKCAEICDDGIDNDGDGLIDSDDLDCLCYEITEYDQSNIAAARAEFEALHYGLKSRIGDRLISGTTHELAVYDVDSGTDLTSDNFAFESSEKEYFSLIYDPAATGTDILVLTIGGQVVKFDPSSYPTYVDGIYMEANTTAQSYIDFDYVRLNGRSIEEVNHGVATNGDGWVIRPGDVSDGFVLDGFVDLTWTGVAPSADQLGWVIEVGSLYDTYKNPVVADIAIDGDQFTICEGNTKTLTASAVGGSGDYIYTWDHGLGSGPVQTISPSDTTVYTVTVRDTSGCESVAQATVNVVEQEPATSSDDVAICEGEIVSISASGGDSYLWSNGQSGHTITVAPASTTTYLVEVTNIFGCYDVEQVTVTVSPELSTNILYSGSPCLRDSMEISASASGGTGPFTYQWVGPAGDAGTTQAIQVDTNGNYYVTVTDSYGCEAYSSGFVYQKYEPFIANLQSEVCEGDPVSLSISGSAVSDYLWSTNAGSATTPSVFVTPTVPASTYSVTVTSSVGCEGVAQATIDVNPKPEAAFVDDATICIGESATVSPTVGGVWSSSNPFIVSVNNAGTITGLAPGNATLTYTEQSTGCSADGITATVNVNPTVVTTEDVIVCNGENITITASGSGTGTLQYLWDQGLGSGSTKSFTAVGSDSVRVFDTYHVTVTDGNGCTASESVDVTIYSNPIPTVAYSSEICGDGNGIITFSFDDHVYRNTIRLSIDDGNTFTEISDKLGSYTFTGLSAGAYDLVAEWGGAECQQSLGTVILASDPIPMVEVSANDGDCGTTSQGSITLTITDAPARDSLLISIDGGATTYATIADSESSYVIEGVNPGTYNVAASWLDGDCPTSLATVTIYPAEFPTLTLTPDLAICEGEITALEASGGDSYLWSTGSDSEVVQVSPSETTVYHVTITSNAGCTSSDSVTVFVSPSLTSTINYNGSQCVVEGSIISAAQVGGTPPYLYQWEGPAGLTAATQDVTVTDFGSYYLTVTDSVGCQAATSGYVYQEFQAFIVNLQTDICEGEEVGLSVSASAGTGYLWSPNAGSAVTPSVTVSPTAPSSSYSVTVTNNVGCQAVATADIAVTPSPTITLSGDASVCIGESTSLAPSTGGIWLSSDPSVVNVTYNGVATGLKAGSSYLSFVHAATGCESDSPILITVEASPEVYFTGPSSVCVGESTTLQPSTGGVWSSSDQTVATVTDAGVVTSIGAGIATFTYIDTITGCAATTSQSLIVQALPVAIVPSAIDLCIESTAQAFPSTGGIWSSSDANVATINNAGVITAVSEGKAAFYYTNAISGCMSALSDSVTVVGVSTLDITGDTGLCAGETTALSPSGGGVWTSNNTAVASVSNGGIVSAVTAGVASFTFTDASTGCETTLSQEVTVYADPILARVGPSQICVGSTSSYAPTTGGSWISNNPAVASITDDGVVTGLAAGTATFTFVDSLTNCSKTTSTPIAVLTAPDITLEGPEQICVGTSSTVFPANTGIWTSDQPGIATVSLSGVVTGISAGTVVLTYTESSSGCQSSESISITVEASPIVSVVGSKELCVDDTTSLQPAVGGVWLSSNPFVASVDNQGVVTAHSTGLARFTYISDSGCTSEQTEPVIVYPPPSTFIVGEASACVGNTISLQPSSGGTWISNSPSIATVSDDGTVTGIMPGAVTFVYTDTITGCVAEESDIVTIDPGPEILISGSDELCIGEQTTLAPTTGGVWSSTNTAVATIDNTGGVVAISPGSSTFVFTDSETGCQSLPSDTVAVIPPPSISYVGSTNICIANTSALSPSSGGVWISNNPAVATVTATGVVTAISQGVASFSFVDDASGCESLLSPPLTVNDAPTVSFSGADEICIGGTTTVQPAGSGDWSTSDSSIATVDSNGIVTAIAPGTVTLSYMESGTGCSTSGDLTLLVSQPADVEVTGPQSICIGATTTLSPSVGGVWTSSNDAIATVDNNGVVRGLAPGAVTFEFLDGSTGCAVSTTTDVVQVLSCVNHDFNVTTADLTITSSIATNDLVPLTTSYSQAYTTVSKPTGSVAALTMSTDGSYSFSSSVPGKYIYSIPVCTNGIGSGCTKSRLEITVVDNIFSVNNPVVNLETATTYTGATPTDLGAPVTVSGMSNDKCINTVGCSLSSSSMSVISDVRHGTTSTNGSGDLTYTPDAGYIGFDTLVYEVCVDGDVTRCSEAMQIFTVNHLSAANSIYAADNFSWTIKGSSVTEQLSRNIGDAEGDVGSVVAQGSASSPVSYSDGEYYITSAGMLSFTPAPEFTGHTEIIYSVCDDNAEQVCQDATIHLLVFDDLQVGIRVYLEGALIDNGNEKGTGNRPLMRDDLRNGPITGENVIPTANPYKYAVDPILDVTPRFMHKGSGLLSDNDYITDSTTVFGVTGENAIVDWIYVQLRSKSDNEQVLATRCGLLQRDGDIVDLDGVSQLRFQGVSADSFYIMVKHRSHLGVMSGLVSNGQFVDFTSPDTEVFNYGTSLPGKPDYTDLSQNSSIKPGYMALWGGDFDGNGHIKFTNPGDDQNFLFFEILLVPGNTFGNINYDLAYGYYQGDYNMNGKAKFTNPNDDLNYLFFQVLLYARNTDYFTNYNFIHEQVPTGR